MRTYNYKEVNQTIEAIKLLGIIPPPFYPNGRISVKTLRTIIAFVIKEGIISEKNVYELRMLQDIWVGVKLKRRSKLRGGPFIGVIKWVRPSFPNETGFKLGVSWKSAMGKVKNSVISLEEAKFLLGEKYENRRNKTS